MVVSFFKGCSFADNLINLPIVIKKADIMKIFSRLLLTASAAFAVILPVAAQEQEEPDIESIAEKEADRLQVLLDLDGGQVFYVDSTLKHDYSAMNQEMKDLRDSKVSNSSMYMAVQDKWMEAIDMSYKKIFSEEQWNTYLKNGAAKSQKARAKRKAKAEAAEEKLRKAFL